MKQPDNTVEIQKTTPDTVLSGRRQSGSVIETHTYSSHIVVSKCCQAVLLNTIWSQWIEEKQTETLRASAEKDLYACTLTKNMHAHFPSAVSQPCLPTHCISNQAWQRTPQVSSVLMAALGPASVCVCECRFSLCWALVSLKSLLNSLALYDIKQTHNSPSIHLRSFSL